MKSTILSEEVLKSLGAAAEAGARAGSELAGEGNHPVAVARRASWSRKESKMKRLWLWWRAI
jgi:hypothetical protein